MKASSISSTGEDSARFHFLGTFRLITEKNMSPFFVASTTDGFISTITCFSYWMQSKKYTRLDAGLKSRSLQDECRLISWKFFFQTQQQGHEKAEEPSSPYIVRRLLPSRDHVQMSMLCCELGRPSW
ncbi:hypothetical protein TNCV_3504671 [Trichonephila clavipes]|uniref:Uncharacterized protein n=1 Tax=Trichonephila clavipes TaxID=2585209 RepID=A0A8X6V2V3_TRICX|nr:hypothetical protein TNCV_3504671 [Trichonephila clavipes]